MFSANDMCISDLQQSHAHSVDLVPISLQLVTVLGKSPAIRWCMSDRVVPCAADSVTSHGSRHHVNPAMWPGRSSLAPAKSGSGFPRAGSSQAPMSRSGSAAEPSHSASSARGVLSALQHAHDYVLKEPNPSGSLSLTPSVILESS